MAPKLGGIKQKKLIIHTSASMSFLLFYSPKPRSQVRIFNISERVCYPLSVSKRLFVRNHSYGNVFPLQVHFHANQTHFHVEGFARELVLKQRHKVPRKWLIAIHLLNEKGKKYWGMLSDRDWSREYPATYVSSFFFFFFATSYFS